jgi:hypothetical protein
MVSKGASQKLLLSLPLELLRRIASHTSCTTVFNLLLTHRRLREACNERLIFKYIAETHHGIKGPEDVWRDSFVLLDNASLEDTKRVAHAVERAVKLVQVEDLTPTIYSNFNERYKLDLHEYLPHLMALRHPCCLYLDPMMFLDLYLKMGANGKNAQIYSRSEMLC